MSENPAFESLGKARRISVLLSFIGITILYCATIYVSIVPISVLYATIPLAIICAWASTYDLFTYTIPDFLNIGIASIGCLFWFVMDQNILVINVIAAIIVFGVFYTITTILFWYSARDALGLGDVKMMSAFVFLIGGADIFWFILLACLFGIAGALVRKILNKNSEIDGIPFGPFIAFSGFLNWTLGSVGL